jgi:hypothetical protein
MKKSVIGHVGFLRGSESTTQFRNTIQQLFKTFSVSVTNNEKKTVEDWSCSEMSEELLDSAGKFLFEATYVSDGKDKFYAVGTTMDYFGGIYQMLRKKFSSRTDLWLQPPMDEKRQPEWYTKARQNLKYMIVERVIKLGDKINPNKSSGIGRNLLGEMVDACERRGDLWGITMKAILVPIFLACGR